MGFMPMPMIVQEPKRSYTGIIIITLIVFSIIGVFIIINMPMSIAEEEIDALPPAQQQQTNVSLVSKDPELENQTIDDSALLEALSGGTDIYGNNVSNTLTSPDQNETDSSDSSSTSSQTSIVQNIIKNFSRLNLDFYSLIKFAVLGQSNLLGLFINVDGSLKYVKDVIMEKVNLVMQIPENAINYLRNLGTSFVGHLGINLAPTSFTEFIASIKSLDSKVFQSIDRYAKSFVSRILGEKTSLTGNFRLMWYELYRNAFTEKALNVLSGLKPPTFSAVNMIHSYNLGTKMQLLPKPTVSRIHNFGKKLGNVVSRLPSRVAKVFQKGVKLQVVSNIAIKIKDKGVGLKKVADNIFKGVIKLTGLGMMSPDVAFFLSIVFGFLVATFSIYFVLAKGKRF